jgi:hypothetical protein
MHQRIRTPLPLPLATHNYNHCRYRWQLTITIGLWRLDAFEFGFEYFDDLSIVLSGEPVGYRFGQQAHPFQLGRQTQPNRLLNRVQFENRSSDPVITGTVWQTHALAPSGQDYGFQTGRGLGGC